MQSEQTLYNKYRPQGFADVVDQNHIKITLQNEIVTGKVAHAYLFTGPRGVGKTTIARILAKAVNCEKRAKDEFEPCNKCASCLDIKQNKSLDLIEIDAASQTKVDQTRENIIAASRVSATAGRVKIFIIDEVHMLSTASFNALLKTLEEPPLKVLFILATTEIHKVPETIISRCQRFDFHRVSVNDLVNWLTSISIKEGCDVDKKVLKAIARQAEGGARDALSLLGQVLTLSDKKVTFEQASLILPHSDINIVSRLITYIIDTNPGAAIELLNKSLSEGIDIIQLAKEIIEYLRYLLLYKISQNKDMIRQNYDSSIQEDFVKQADIIDVTLLVNTIDIFIKRLQDIKVSAIQQLPIELAIISATQLKQTNIQTSIDDNTSAQKKTSVEKKKDQLVDLSPKKVIEEKIIVESEQKNAIVNIDTNVKLEALKAKWQEIVIALKDYNHTLSAFMRVARPISCEAGVFLIGFKYSFHEEILEDIAKRKIVEDVIADKIGSRVAIRGLVDQEYDSRDEWLVELAEAEPVITDGVTGIDHDAEVDVAAAFG